MGDALQNIIMCIKVLVVFWLLFIYVPSKLATFDEESRGKLDRIFISLTHMTFFIIVIVHLLVFAVLYDSVSLAVSLVFLYMAIRRKRIFRRAQGRDGSIPGLLKLMDSVDSFEDFFGLCKSRLKSLFIKAKNSLLLELRLFFTRPFQRLIPAIVIMAASALRFYHAFNHAAFSHIDVYGSLIRLKRLGENAMYSASTEIYPSGSHAVISALSKLSFLDSYWFCRFFGPFCGVLLVLSVYYFALRITGSYTSSLVSLTIYGLMTNASFPSVMFRQTAAMPQEFAAIFILPGLWFFWLYLKTGRKNYLLLYCEALAITVLCHQYATVYLVFWAAIMYLCSLMFIKLDFKSFVHSAGYTFITCVAGMLPMVIGMLLGSSFHKSSFEMVENVMDFRDIFTEFGNWLASGEMSFNPFLESILAITVLLLAGLILYRSRERQALLFSTACTAIAMYLMYRASLILPEQVPELLGPARIGVFAALVFAVYYAVGFMLVKNVIVWIARGLRIEKAGKFAAGIVSIAVCCAVVFFYPPGKPYAGVYEYDSAAENYLRIKKEFPPLDWTIVAPHEQLAQVLSYGRHYQLITFIWDFSLEDAKNPILTCPYQPATFSSTWKKAAAVRARNNRGRRRKGTCAADAGYGHIHAILQGYGAARHPDGQGIAVD